jgi:hypothetical protein
MCEGKAGHQPTHLPAPNSFQYEFSAATTPTSQKPKRSSALGLAAQDDLISQRPKTTSAFIG